MSVFRGENEVNGLNINLGSNFAGRTSINGGNFNLMSVHAPKERFYDSTSSTVNGLDISIFSIPDGENHDTFKPPISVNGYQFGLIVFGKGKVVQNGVFCGNESKDGKSSRTIPIINWRFD